jgi:glutathione S-transferase
MATITVPSTYGYTILTCTVLPFITSTVMGSVVMEARKKFNVPYPNLYATPGLHKQADEFNRVQRGHQSLFEQLSSFMALSLLGGIKHPITTAVAGLLFCIGNYLYLLGYSDTTLAVESARYKKGGVLKIVGFVVSLGTCISFAGSVSGWW